MSKIKDMVVNNNNNQIKGEKEMAAPLKRSQLVNTVNEINEILKPKQPLKITEDMKIADISKILKEDCAGQLMTTDPFSELALGVFQSLGIELVKPEKAEFNKVKEEPKTEKKPVGKRSVVKHEKDTEAEHPKKSEEKKPAGKKGFEKKAYSRMGCMGLSINEMKSGESVSVENLIKIANEKYVEFGGSSNLKECKWYWTYAEKLLNPLGIIEVSTDGKTITKL